MVMLAWGEACIGGTEPRSAAPGYEAVGGIAEEARYGATQCTGDGPDSAERVQHSQGGFACDVKAVISQKDHGLKLGRLGVVGQRCVGAALEGREAQAAAAIVTETPLNGSVAEGALGVVEEDGLVGGWRKMIEVCRHGL